MRDRSVLPHGRPNRRWRILVDERDGEDVRPSGSKCPRDLFEYLRRAIDVLNYILRDVQVDAVIIECHRLEVLAAKLANGRAR